MSSQRLLPLALLLGLLGGTPAIGAPVILSFTGEIALVVTDTGTGQLAGTQSGDRFAGAYGYEPPPSFLGSYPFGADFSIAGLGFLARAGGPEFIGGELIISINNNEPLDADVADLINDLVAPAPPVAAGQATDAWSISAVQAGASRGEDDATVNGVSWDLVLLSLTGDLYDSLFFRLLPPAFDDVEVRAMLITEGDNLGNTLFQAILLLDGVEVTVVPLPAGAWLLLTGVLLVGARRLYRPA